MSKKAEMQDSLNSLVSGFIATEPPKEVIDTPKVNPKAKKEPKQVKEIVNKEIVNISTTDDNKLTYDAKQGRYNKTNNYTITFKIDEDIKDYLKLIDKITFIESAKSGKIKSTTRTEFVNDLIRDEFYKLIGASKKDDANTIKTKWLTYKDNNNL